MNEQRNDNFFSNVGRSHDRHVFEHSDPWLHQWQYFSPGQYLIADSAYPVSTVTLCSFKGRDLTQDETDFNSCITHVCACNEHTIGMLKRRFMSLRELPILVKEETYEKDMSRAQDWIVACAILHNFLIEQNEILDPKLCRDEFVMEVGGAPPPQPPIEEENPGKRFRLERMTVALHRGWGEEGILTYNAQHNPFNLRVRQSRTLN